MPDDRHFRDCRCRSKCVSSLMTARVSAASAAAAADDDDDDGE